MKLSILAVGVFSIVVGVLGVQAQEVEKAKVINGGVLNGKAISLPKPEYPTHLREQGIGGTVSVDVIIDESGMVISAAGRPSVIKTRAGADGMMAEKVEIDPALVQAAENAAVMARFSPTSLSGVPVRIQGTITYNFVAGEKSPGEDASDIKTGVLNARAVSLPLPGYPPAAKAVGAQGAVNVLVRVNEAGEVIEAEAVSGHPLLRAAAVKAARDARFSQTSKDGQPIQVTGILVYNFVAGEKTDQ